jgi:hypothetical protein
MKRSATSIVRNWAALSQKSVWNHAGRPIKKDKRFFFVNYEGILEVTGQTNLKVVPDANALQGLIPTSAAPAGSCSGVGTIGGIVYSNCGLGSANASKFAIIQPYLNLYSANLRTFCCLFGHRYRFLSIGCQKS